MAHPRTPSQKQAHAAEQKRRRIVARQRGVALEALDRERVYNAHGGRCGVCKAKIKTADWHIDHRVPLAKGGTNTYRNAQPAHKECNLTKGATDGDE